MTEMYESEKRKVAEGTSDEGEGLTEREIYGNIFVINFAGHDTVYVFTFAVYFLASNPAVQDWVSEELHHVLGDQPPQEWNYTAEFPRIKRCLAVFYESMRMYTPIPVTKWTKYKAQTLDVGDKTLVLPPNTMICLAYSSLQTDPRCWGSDSLTWRPSRFTKTAAELDPESSVPQTQGGDETWMRSGLFSRDAAP
ncbi:hypothetical protein J3458_016835 [Metarhizium acridum]|uniref:uncharacterized protein n=1 Tax=Metarhizium acridum TaxID=92637 RepID=UPI001C6C4914|nr:hypothetical protein J3458_016835 [Metarhizium acridum]